MHYRGLLRVARREGGIRLYAAREPHPAAADPAAALDMLIDVIVRKYAPLPQRSLSELVHHLRLGAPQWADGRRAALDRALQRLPQARIGGIVWVWPAGESPGRQTVPDEVRLLAPFDPVVWDRRRFEAFWGWAYRFEAYTPAAQRVRGYYALPLLWRDAVIGWANVAAKGGSVVPQFGYVAGRAPRDAAYRRALDAELERMRIFLDQ
jgi:uncharacterized protein YcaQ